MGISKILGIFQTYPEIILSLVFFLLFYILSLWRNPTSKNSLINFPLVGMLPSALANLHRIHDFATDVLTNCGGTIVFKGPWFCRMEYVVTADSANVQHVLNTNFPNYPKGPEFSEIFDLLGDGIFNADGESWKAQRRAALVFMGDRAFRQFVADVTRDKTSIGLVGVMNYFAAAGEVVDVQDVFMRVAFDVMSTTVFGLDMGCVSPSFPIIGFPKAMDDVWDTLIFRHAMPIFVWKILRWLNIGKEKTLRNSCDTIDQFIQQRIHEKREQNKQSPPGADLLSSYIENPICGGEAIFGTDKFLRDTVLTLMIAGRDGFAITLTWLTYLLCKHPHVEKKILYELKSRAEKLKSPVTFGIDEVSSMIYLHAAVLETLRLYPPVPFELKSAVDSDVLPTGEVVQPGVKVLISVYAMARMESVWGKDSREFSPERWFDGGGKIRYVPAYKFMAFNSGPRSCLGRDIALVQVKTVIANFLWNFSVELAGDAKDVRPSIAIMLRTKSGLRVRVRKREH